MRQRFGVLSVMVAFVVLASCGGGSGGGPNNPTPTPTPTSITINSSGTTMFVGQTETFTATLAFSNGTTQVLTGGTWGSDAPSVATVNPTTGLVTSVARGDVTIFVDAQGLRGTKRITVNSSYNGTWTGTYQATNCTQTADFALGNFCSLINIGASYPVLFNLSQTGTTVTGQTFLGSLPSSSFTATVAANGSLTFTAVHTDATLSISQLWQLTMSANGQLAGTVVQTWTESSLAGQMVISGTLQTVVRSAADAPLHRRSGVSGRSLREAISALVNR